MKNIAVLGLGKMGAGIASRLIDSGFTVFIWNRTRLKAQPLLEKGAIWTDFPAQAALKADILISMVADDTASSAVWNGEQGAMKNMKEGSYMIECSTLSYDHVIGLSGEAKRRGVHYIDCPVTGWPEHASKGTLTLLVGADPDHLAPIKECLSAFSHSIFYFGETGKGTSYKLIINLLGAVQIAGLAEAIALAEKIGLPTEMVVKAIQTSVAASPQIVHNTSIMAERNFSADPHFTVGLRWKDTSYAVELAGRYDANIPLGQVALQWFASASRLGSSKDQAVVIEVVS
jgi:3-hydroxyisobutyrate dehydrogenase